MKTISVARLREVLNYDPETGIFTRRIRLARRSVIGEVVGSKNSKGYLTMCIDGCVFKAHRLAIAYVRGEFPTHQVDHRNGDKSDNRYCNLRCATNAENQQNITLTKRNTSGYLGVSFYKPTQRWVAQIRLHKKGYHLGYFKNPEEAYAAYLAAKEQLHNFQPTPR